MKHPIEILAQNNMSSMIQVVTFLVFHISLSTSSSSGELIDAYYKRTGGKDVQLLGLFDRNVHVKDLWQCARSCMQNVYCFSFNFGAVGDGSGLYDCVHNVDTSTGSGMPLTPRTGFLYYEQKSTVLPSPGVVATAHNNPREDFYLAYNGWLYLFPDLNQMPVATPSAYFYLQGYDVTGLHVIPGAATNEELFTAYLDDGTVMNMTLDMTGPSWTVSPAINITQYHGPSAPQYVDDIITFNGTSYLLYDDVVYVLDDALQVVESFHSRDTRAWNVFEGAPLKITACTELVYPSAYFFKGVRYYQYNFLQRKVFHGGVLIDER